MTPRHRAVPPSPLASAAVLALAALSGCGGGADEGVERTVDASGTEIVTITRSPDDFDAIGTLAAEPDLQIASVTDNPVDIFGSIRGIRAFPDGQIVVADGQQSRLAFFAADGTPVSVLGARGEAPGQFRSLSRISMVNADSLWVWDQQAERVTVFERDGTVARLMRLVHPDPDRSYARTFVLADRSFLGVSDARIAPPPNQFETGHDFQRDTVQVVHHGDLGSVIGSVASFPGADNLRVWQSPQPNVTMSLVAPLPFRRAGHYTLVDELVVGGPNDRFELSWWNLDGDLARVTRFPANDRPITSEDVTALRNQWLSDAGDSEARIELVEIAFDEAPIPDVFPAFGQIVTSRDGYVWVREHDLVVEGSPRWWRFDAAGGATDGYVEFPADLEVHEIGADHVLGVWRDQTGLQHVRRYALTLY
jgi:hypothetical protein